MAPLFLERCCFYTIIRTQLERNGLIMLKTILVVDDDEDIVKLITKSLRYEQFEILPAYSGKEALTALEENHIEGY
ncbi:hypothetical protein GCM10010913_48850 [Paenibacillus aceti]|uniref:Response regulatory domain-containing protein n=1 Tax=Paenibacillus aceti TaxID=1820010 RepID=A0ABQ1W8U4_9BACL|nr:hypothetical protein GCM10010913_48850 [Paenibacillus aceti]